MFWLNAFTGKRFDLGSPKIDDIDIVDIAMATGTDGRARSSAGPGRWSSATTGVASGPTA